MHSQLKLRLDAHFVMASVIGAGLTTMMVAERAEAAIVYSGIANLSMPGTIDGVYLNMVTGVTGTSAATCPGYDFNPYSGGFSLFMPAAQGNAAMGSGNVAANIANGTLIGPASSFATGSDILSMSNFAPGGTGFVGVRFRREFDNATLYGWVRITKSLTSATAGTIIDWAYEDQGIALTAGFLPAPGALGILALGAMRGKRRRNEP